MWRVMQAGRQCCLARLQGHDALFNRAARYQFVNRHRAGLADAVCAVCGLGFDCRVLPRVKVDHGIGLRQIQSHTAGFEADQKQRHSP